MMELGLSLGDASKSFGFLEKDQRNNNKGLGFCMGLNERDKEEEQVGDGKGEDEDEREDSRTFQLDLLPQAPVRSNPISSHLGFPWPTENNNGVYAGSSELASSARGFDVNRLPSAEEFGDGAVSSPNSMVSSFQMDISIYRKRELESAGNEIEMERASSRSDEEDQNSLTRKKLRLSKEQSAFLEESFKEHNTLNPKQKLALAKQLNLRPRQVEVWFQNRRARTKLKQTEVDCEYLKRCCETLTEENRRLQKELQELRALKTSHSFCMQFPATTLTMCPSCERVATTTTTNPSTAVAAASTTTTTTDSTITPFSITKPRFYPFSHPQPHAPPSAAS